LIYGFAKLILKNTVIKPKESHPNSSASKESELTVTRFGFDFDQNNCN
jgi:hypothetical protein